MRHKTLTKHGEDWPTGCSTSAALASDGRCQCWP